MKSIEIKRLNAITIVAATIIISVLSGHSYAEKPGAYGISIGTAYDDGLDETKTSGKISLMTDHSEHFGAEVGVAYFGSFPSRAGSLGQSALLIHGVGSQSVGGNFKVHAKIGFGLWRVAADGYNTETGMNASYGLGISYSLKTMALRAEYEVVNDVLGSNVSMTSVGVLIPYK